LWDIKYEVAVNREDAALTFSAIIETTSVCLRYFAASTSGKTAFNNAFSLPARLKNSSFDFSLSRIFSTASSKSFICLKLLRVLT